jgi:hypothetical protein
MVPVVHEPLGRYDVIIRVARDGGQLPDPVTFAVAADQAASRRSASIISVHMADTIINVVTVTAPGEYAALAVARAVVSDALKLQASSPILLGSDAPYRAASLPSRSRMRNLNRPARSTWDRSDGR